VPHWAAAKGLAKELLVKVHSVTILERKAHEREKRQILQSITGPDPANRVLPMVPAELLRREQSIPGRDLASHILPMVPAERLRRMASLSPSGASPHGLIE
jgi:hypothetical protein